MAKFYPFSAIRPEKNMAEAVACLPYDVLSAKEAGKLAENPHSFVHVIRSEADLCEDIDPYSQAVYDQAESAYQNMKREGTLFSDEQAYYIYREISSDHTQTGIVGCASVRDYRNGTVRRHELTVAAKEDDRTRHILTTRAQTGMVFLTFPGTDRLRDLLNDATKEEPVYDLVQNEVRHQIWKISDSCRMQEIAEIFEEIPVLYIADGHHRAASSARVAEALGAGENDEAGRFLAAAFPAEDLSLLGYHRVVRDLNGMQEAQFLEEISKSFDLAPCEKKPPEHMHEIIMITGGKWYSLKPHADLYDEADSIARLDVSILQNSLLDPLLAIRNPRTDSRISFIGGKDAMAEVEKRTEKSGSVGFLLYPTDIHDLIAAADDHRIMPPKSTWFEPKLLSGLLIHEI